MPKAKMRSNSTQPRTRMDSTYQTAAVLAQKLQKAVANV